MGKTFRPRAALLGVLAGAALAWILVLVLLFTLRDVEGKTYLSVCFFIGFFATFLVYYATQAIVVDTNGLVVRRFLAFTSFEFKDILQIDVHPGPAMTIYDVLTRKGPIQFSSWFRGHKELLELIVRGAKLEARA